MGTEQFARVPLRDVYVYSEVLPQCAEALQGMWWLLFPAVAHMQLSLQSDLKYCFCLFVIRQFKAHIPPKTGFASGRVCVT